MIQLITILIIAFLAIPLSGCAKLSHLPQLLTLKGYSDNKDAQTTYVRAQRANFERLLKAIETGEIKKYHTQKDFRKEFKEPVFHHPKVVEGIEYDMWMYRDIAIYKDGEKVYLYFDNEGNLHHYEHHVPPKKEEDKKKG